MNSVKKIVLAVILLISFSKVFSADGYNIKVKVRGIHDTTMILGHHFAGNMIPDDTIKVDKNGSGVFKGKTTLPQGMYIVYLPNKTYFDFVLGANQKFSLENDTNNLFKNIKFTDSPENDIFYGYQFYLQNKREEAKKLQDEKKSATSDAEKNKIIDKLKGIDSDVKSYTAKVIADHPDMFVSKFIKSTQEVQVPDFPKDANGKVLDSAFQYNYYCKHFFDNFDISDGRLLRTPIYEEKIKSYLKLIPQTPDSIKAAIDMLIAKSRTSPELFRYMLVTLLKEYAESQIMGFDDIGYYVADKYYVKEATWADTASINKMKKEVAKQLPLGIGKSAPDVQLVYVPKEHFIAAKDSMKLKRDPYVGGFFNISGIKTDFTILVFWEADCGHCKKAIPELYTQYQKFKNKSISIVAVSTLFGEEGKVKWVDFVNEHKLYDWVNAWNPYDFKFKDIYNILSTPQIFILDKSHKIIAKRIGPEQCEEIINHYIEIEKRKNTTAEKK